MKKRENTIIFFWTHLYYKLAHPERFNIWPKLTWNDLYVTFLTLDIETPFNVKPNYTKLEFGHGILKVKDAGKVWNWPLWVVLIFSFQPFFIFESTIACPFRLFSIYIIRNLATKWSRFVRSLRTVRLVPSKSTLILFLRF